MSVAAPLCAKVVLAEDSMDDEMLAMRAFRRAGVPVAVQVAHDGEGALEVLGLRSTDGEAPRPPRLVVLDVKMPKVAGPEVLRRIREDARYADVPVVMLSSSDEPADVELCRERGASGYLKKPVGFDEFIDAVHGVVQYWLSEDEGAKTAPDCLFDSGGGN